MTEQPTLAFILDLERQVWEALKSGNREADARLLSDEFVGVYASGVGSKEGHVGQLDGGATVVAYEITEPQLLTLHEGMAMLIYRATWWRPGKVDPTVYYISSIWQCSDRGWLNIFSQDTEASQYPSITNQNE